MRQCVLCGAYLDADEKCDCTDNITALSAKWSKLTRTDNNKKGQLTFDFSNRDEVMTNGVYG